MEMMQKGKTSGRDGGTGLALKNRKKKIVAGIGG
jgi:hypothetical protein